MKHLLAPLLAAFIGLTAQAQSTDNPATDNPATANDATANDATANDATANDATKPAETPATVDCRGDILYVLNPMRFREGETFTIAALRKAGYTVKTASGKDLTALPFATTLHSLTKTTYPSGLTVDVLNGKVNVTDYRIIVFGSHQNGRLSPDELAILKAALDAKKVVVAEVPGVKFGPDYITEQAAGLVDQASWEKRFRSPSAPKDFPYIKAKDNIIVFNNLGAASGGPLPKPADNIAFCEKQLLPTIKKAAGR